MPRLDEQLKQAAGPPTPPLDYAAVLDRARRLRRRRTVVTGAAMAPLIAVLAGAVWLVSLRDTVDVAANVLEMPPRGGASGQFLADGTPVWVTHTTHGDVYVLEAQYPNGMHAWATHALLCDDPLLESRWGSRFAADGTAITGGPAPHGLRRIEILERSATQVVVGSTAPEPQPRDPVTGQGEWYARGLPWCPADPQFVAHPEWADTFERWYRQWYGD